ncbi:hypothetical protein [Amycolatopsis japonica]
MTDTSNWRERAGRILLDPADPDGEPLTTPLDRRWLWRIEQVIAINGGNDTMRQLAFDLKQYLNETCEHHWRLYAREKDIPSHTQCLWCCTVEWLEQS